MAKFFKEKIIPFTVSFFSCGLIYTVITLACIIPQSRTLNVQQSLSEQPYYSPKAERLKSSILVVISNTPYCFFVNLDSANSKCEVLFFTTSCIKNSSIEFDVTNIRQSAKAFFGLAADHFITLSTDNLSAFIDLVGGVTAETPYGHTSPANENKYIAGNEELHFFGDTALSILLSEVKPDTEHLIYYAKIIALSCSTALKNYKRKAFDFIIEKCKTDISYMDFYDNEVNLSLCAENIQYSAPKGAWLNDKYYLQ